NIVDLSMSSRCYLIICLGKWPCRGLSTKKKKKKKKKTQEATKRDSKRGRRSGVVTEGQDE
ncbi:hypothetical protein OFM35_30265, partial [Escherichia coli]|nr:hypothetical protein [Escherichia coli]